MFEPYLTRWRLTPEGAPIRTRSSRLLAVRWRGRPAMLKIAIEAEEQFGGILMQWWNGEGAACVYRHEGPATLMERAEGPRSLVAMARGGEDDAATRILCTAIARLHAPRGAPPEGLVRLPDWFASLRRLAPSRGGWFAEALAVAEGLLAEERDIVPLHGDIHHGNVLDFGPRGWLAIDPKRVIGERGFDYANLFCNPDLATAADPACFAARIEIVSAMSGLARERLLRWVIAWTGLSAAWFVEDGEPCDIDEAVFGHAVRALNR